jgi:predicted PurR-regulated permease PerM
MEQQPERFNILQINATVAAGGVLLLCTVFVMSRILPGLLWAFVLAIALWPSYLKVRALSVSAGWRRVGAPLLLTLLIAALVAAPVAFAAVEMVRESESFMGWINDARAHGIAVPPAAADIPWIGGPLSSWWQANLATPDAATVFFGGLGPRNLLGLTRNLGPELLHRALLFGITLLTLFFLFRDGEELGARMLPLADKAFGNRSRPIAAHVIDAVHGTVDGLVLVGFVEGLVIGVGYWVTGVPHPIAFSIATSVVAAIPFGAPLVFCLAALLLFGLGKALAGIGLAVFGFLVVFITDHLVRPAVIGGAARIPFLLVLLGILGGLSSLGLVGLFVGPALMAVFVAIWRDLAEDEHGAEITPVAPG